MISKGNCVQCGKKVQATLHDRCLYCDFPLSKKQLFTLEEKSKIEACQNQAEERRKIEACQNQAEERRKIEAAKRKELRESKHDNNELDIDTFI